LVRPARGALLGPSLPRGKNCWHLSCSRGLLPVLISSSWRSEVLASLPLLKDCILVSILLLHVLGVQRPAGRVVLLHRPCRWTPGHFAHRTQLCPRTRGGSGLSGAQRPWRWHHA